LFLPDIKVEYYTKKQMQQRFDYLIKKSGWIRKLHTVYDPRKELKESRQQVLYDTLVDPELIPAMA
jgi:hypothetical protein